MRHREEAKTCVDSVQQSTLISVPCLTNRDLELAINQEGVLLTQYFRSISQCKLVTEQYALLAS